MCRTWSVVRSVLHCRLLRCCIEYWETDVSLLYKSSLSCLHQQPCYQCRLRWPHHSKVSLRCCCCLATGSLHGSGRDTEAAACSVLAATDSGWDSGHLSDTTDCGQFRCRHNIWTSCPVMRHTLTLSLTVYDWFSLTQQILYLLT